jgi:LacI family transcriptional regulator
MAVSVVLNGARSNTRVSDATRRRILTIAADLNYAPNAMARSLKRQRTNTIGVLFTWAGHRTIHNMYSVTVLDGIVEGAAAAGYHVLLYTQRWHNAEVSTIGFSDHRADGVVVVAPRENSDVVSGLTALGLRTALVSSVSEIPDIPSVDVDNRAGIRLAMEHLWKLGHTNIGYVGYGTDRHSMRERIETFHREMTAYKLPVHESHVRADLHPSLESASILSILQLSDRPTALIAANDDLAAVVIDCARQIGISVPEQLSVIGFDDILVASLTTPKLTTIRQPLFEMGRQAASLLIESIEGRGEAQTDFAHIFMPELIVRESTASPCPRE